MEKGLLTSMSMLPDSFRKVLNKKPICLDSEMSACKKVVLHFIFWIKLRVFSASASRSRSLIPMLHPASARAKAIPRPIFRFPPVIKAFLPESVMAISINLIR